MNQKVIKEKSTHQAFCPFWSRFLTSVALASLAFALLAVLFLGKTTAQTKSDAPPVETNEVVDPQAMKILLEMTRTIADAKQFSVTIRSSYDAPQENGQMIEFGAVRRLQVKRPNLLRLDVHRSDGDQRLLLFDGERIIVQNINDNVYTKVEHISDIDGKIKYLVGDLQIPLPLGRMLRTVFPADIERLVKAIDYVELDMLTDVPADHLAFRTDDVDVQVWVAGDKEPLPGRIVITYKHAEGQPQFRAVFSDWNLSGETVKGPFIFTPPKDCEQIPILTAISQKKKFSIPAGGVK
jgi:hypothetical protein